MSYADKFKYIVNTNTSDDKNQEVAGDHLMLPIIQSRMVCDTILNDAIMNLEILSKLQRGDVLSATDDYFSIGQKTFANVVSRTILHDSRFRALNKIFKCIYTLVEFAEKIKESKYFSIHERMSYIISAEDLKLFIERNNNLLKISAVMQASLQGMDNFVSLYESDTALGAKIKNLKEYTKTYSEGISEWVKMQYLKRENYLKFRQAEFGSKDN
jgi:hypothetical protein